PDNFDTRDRPHIPIDAFRETAAYERPPRNQERKPLRDDYAAHAARLLDQLAVALGDLPLPGDDARISLQGLKPGTIVEIATLPPPEASRAQSSIVPSDLAVSPQHVVQLRSERDEHRSLSALAYVPEDAHSFLSGTIPVYCRDLGT